MNKNSNTYIILYSIVMVVVVAVLLSVASLSLQDKQTANELNEKKNNILTSLGMTATEVDFDATIESFTVNAEGVATPLDKISSNKSLREQIEQGNYILFRTKEDGRVVVPVVGKGLWDDIWGYVALENDLNTISGIVLAHKQETPGLGAEIATEKHQNSYKGKKIFRDGAFVSITLRKGGAQDKDHEVDAITGGTKTSDGVTAMLHDCLTRYVPYFQKSTATEAVSTEEVENPDDAETTETTESEEAQEGEAQAEQNANNQ